MSDASRDFEGENPVSDEHFITSWARISLDYGHPGVELADEQEPDKDADLADRVRAEIEQMIGAIRQAAQGDSGAEEDSVLARLNEIDLSPELLEQMVQATDADGEDVPESERSDHSESSDSEGPGGLLPRIDNNTVVVDLSASPLPGAAGQKESAEGSSEGSDGDDGESADFDPEFDRQVAEASTDEVVQALILASADVPEVLVYEADENHVDVFVLCIWGEYDQLVTARLGESGVLEAGIDFEEFAAELLDFLPVRGGLCATEDSYSLGAQVTALGEELILDADSRVAALIELEAPEVPLLVSETWVAGPVDAVPADNGWTLVSADPVSMLNLLQNLGKPAVVAESNGFNHHLAFIVPGGSSASEFNEGSWGEWMQKVVGSPEPDSTDSGAVIDLHWGAAKVLTRYLPQRSFALDTLWSLPGNLPEPLNFVRINDEVENLTWVYGLEESATKRLRNYVEDSSSELGMESVLQLLGLPDDLAKVVLEQLDIGSLSGHRVYAPQMSLSQAAVESVKAYPNGNGALSAAQRKVLKYPWIFAADGALQLSASALLAGVAARRRASGESARAASVASAALACTGLAELALARAYQKQKRIQGEPLPSEEQVLTPRPLSLMEELQTSAVPHPSGKDETRPDYLDRAKQHVSDLARKLGRRFRRK